MQKIQDSKNEELRKNTIEHYNKISAEFFSYYQTKERSIWSCIVLAFTLSISARFFELPSSYYLISPVITAIYICMFYILYKYMREHLDRRDDAKKIVVCCRKIVGELCRTAPSNKSKLKRYISYSKSCDIPDLLAESVKSSYVREHSFQVKTVYTTLFLFFVISQIQIYIKVADITFKKEEKNIEASIDSIE